MAGLFGVWRALCWRRWRMESGAAGCVPDDGGGGGVGWDAIGAI